MTISFGNLSRSEKLEFVFQHPVDFNDPWHFNEIWEYECESVILIEFMTDLFSNAEELASKYSYEQIDQGFWFIPGPNGFMWSILDSSLDEHKRVECIESVYFLFSNFFSRHNVGTSIYMWWDSFFSYCANDEKTIADDINILKVVSSVIEKLSHHQTDYIRKSSEHGKQHLLKIINMEDILK